MTTVTRITLGLWTAAAVAVAGCSPGGADDDGPRPPAGLVGVDDEALDAAREAALDGPARVWVLFADKGIGAHELDDALAARRAEIAPAALQRRLRSRGDDGVDALDLAVPAAYVDAVAATGARVRVVSRWLAAVSVEADRDQLAAIEALPFVLGVRPVARSLPLPAHHRLPRQPGTPPPAPPRDDGAGKARDAGVAEEQLSMIDGIGPYECGFQGDGVVVGIIDTGFTVDHESPAHVDVADEWDFVFGDAVTSNEAADTVDQEHHGTGVLSVIAGLAEGEYRGIAPGVTVLLAKTEDLTQEVPAEEDRWVAALEWIETHNAGADLVASSLGYIDWWTSEDTDGATAVTSIAAGNAVTNGLIVVLASGNVGPDPMSLAPPADAFGALAVGAVGYDGLIAEFSSRGPTYDGRTKPDVVAPGENIWLAESTWFDAYYPDSGTSYSAPLVAGAVALLKEQYPQLGPQAVTQRFVTTASQAGAPDDDYGYGLVSVDSALGDYCPCADNDGDGYPAEACGGTDCADNDGDVNPGEVEVCDGVDTDCDGDLLANETDGDGDGYLACHDDCDDDNHGINPGVQDVPYDGTDQDCDGEDLTDVDGDGADGGPEGEDCDDQQPLAFPGNDEVCDDEIDNDCDGAIDGADDECGGGGGDDWAPPDDGNSWGCYCDTDGPSSEPWAAAAVVALLAAVLRSRRR